MTEPIYMLYSTFATRDEAFFAARTLLEARLIACANILDGALSLYRWEGEVQQVPETVCLAKTTRSALDAAMALLKSRHSYQNPCVLAWPVEKGHAPFLEWVGQETAPSKS